MGVRETVKFAFLTAQREREREKGGKREDGSVEQGGEAKLAQTS